MSSRHRISSHIRRCGPALCAFVALTYSAALAAQSPGLPELTALADDGARVSALVVDLHERKPLATLNAHRRLTPASISKLYTTAAVLEQWGPEHRFVTHFMSGAPLVDDTLHGDLVFLGAGDPDLNTERLLGLVTRLRQAGVQRIAGDLVVNNSLFGDVPCQSKDRCDALRSSGSAYDAPISAAGVNFSLVELALFPAERTGEAVRVVTQPPLLAGIVVDGQVDTVASGSRPFVRLLRRSYDDEETLHLGGRLPAQHPPLRVVRSISSPERYTGRVIAALLQQNGIAFDGDILVDSEALPAKARSLASIQSGTLADQLRTMMVFSNNYMADVLTLHLLARGSRRPPVVKLPEASSALELLAHLAITEAGLELEPDAEEQQQPLVLDSGSGLTVTSRISAHDVVSLLAMMYREPSLFPSFYNTLTVPRFARARMLRGGNADFAQRVAGKTGSLTEPVSVRSFAGYLRLNGGGWAAFAIIINGTEDKPSIPGPDLMDAIRADLEGLLEHH